MRSARILLRHTGAAFLLLLLCLRAVADDGPYVMRGASGALEAWWARTTKDGPRKRVEPLASNATVTIPGVGTVPSFKVRLRGPADVAPDEVSVPRNVPLFVVADTHGEFEILVDMLKRHGVLDRRLRWSFGRGHLVILGDMFDRGAHQTEILWLLYALEAEARKAGGGVHVAIGNHEAMVLRGDVRYLNPKYGQTAQVLGVASYSALFAPDSVLGQWLRSKASMIRIGDLCLHGGVSAELVARGYSLQQVNSTLRAVLDDRTFTSPRDLERAQFLSGEAGPWWYRGYFANGPKPAAATAEDVRRIREHFAVSRILVGHTRVPAITPLYDGAVIAIQVYPRREPNGETQFEALLARDGKFLRAGPDGQTQELAP